MSLLSFDDLPIAVILFEYYYSFYGSPRGRLREREPLRNKLKEYEKERESTQGKEEDLTLFRAATKNNKFFTLQPTALLVINNNNNKNKNSEKKRKKDEEEGRLSNPNARRKWSETERAHVIRRRRGQRERANRQHSLHAFQSRRQSATERVVVLQERLILEFK
jgi:hypothetical protein